jgi:hypothetical protein
MLSGKHFTGGRHRFTARGLIASLALSSALTTAAPSRAQTDEDRAGARALATQGAQAFSEQRWADAIDLFSRAESLVHAPPHLLYLARACVQAGQLVRAREAYMRIVREPIAPNAPAAFQQAQVAAKQELPALEPRIAYLTIQVKEAPASVSVTLDGKPIPPALVGVARPADPGEHKVQATAEGAASEVASVVLKEGARETVILELQAGLAPATPAETTPADSAAESRAAIDAQATPADAGTSSNGMRYASYAALGVGVVGLGLGTVFALKSASARSDADELCPDANRCPVRYRSEVEGLDDDAASAQKLAIVGFAVGGVGIAAGVTLFLLSGKKQDATPATASAVRVNPWIGYRSAGVTGTF